MTALRWAKRMRELGHRVRLTTTFDGSAWDVLVALHAHRSADAVRRCREHSPSTPVVVALAGTDVYREGGPSEHALASIEAADAIVALQPLALHVLPDRARAKARVIFQSAQRL